METKTHWENVYETKASTEVSWFQEHPEVSLQLIERSNVDKSGQIIDIGGGASTLADNFAVFHFLTNAADRQKYVKAVMSSVKTGGHVIIATFGIDGPSRCSGLEIVRYNPDTLHNEFGNNFDLVHTVSESHETPFGIEQKFIYCYFRKG